MVWLWLSGLAFGYNIVRKNAKDTAEEGKEDSTMITSLIIIGLAKLFSGMGLFANVSRGNLAYLCYLCGLVVFSAGWLVNAIMAL